MDLNTIRSVPSWLSWLERQSHNLKVVSSSLTEGKNFFKVWDFDINIMDLIHFQYYLIWVNKS